MEKANKFYIYKIPFISEGKSTATTIGVHDASGSMVSVWRHNAEQYNILCSKIKEPVRTIAFSTNSQFVNGPLNVDIKKHGCERTNISEAFKLTN